MGIEESQVDRHHEEKGTDGTWARVQVERRECQLSI